jgi:c-di-GMP-binding flagellar brake protein YcgR
MEFLKVNQKLQIVLESSPNSTKTCVSQILDYDNASMLIAEPSYKAQGVNVQIGTVIEVLVIDSKCVYSFNTSVIGKQKSPAALWLSLPETYRRVQRREYVRVNIKLPAVISLKGETLIKEECIHSNVLAESLIENGYFSTNCIDVSGGGVKVFTPLLFEADSVVKLMLRLPMKEIVANATVIRSDINTKISEKEFTPKEYAKFNYITALCFSDIDDADRSTIIQLCFKRQLELRQRGIV